jgi:hypothetical protein
LAAPSPVIELRKYEPVIGAPVKELTRITGTVGEGAAERGCDR